MYATINLPGSSHFEYHGPATRQECESWLKARTAELAETELITSLLPQRVVTNRDAESWKYLDGSRVVRTSELHQIGGNCRNCKRGIPLEYWVGQAFCPTCEMFCVTRADGTIQEVY